jgi:hypothetical protein
MSESPRKLHCGNCSRDCTEDPLVQVHQIGEVMLVFCLDCEKELGEKLRVLVAAFNPPVNE